MTCETILKLRSDLHTLSSYGNRWLPVGMVGAKNFLELAHERKQINQLLQDDLRNFNPCLSWSNMGFNALTLSYILSHLERSFSRFNTGLSRLIQLKRFLECLKLRELNGIACVCGPVLLSFS